MTDIAIELETFSKDLAKRVEKLKHHLEIERAMLENSKEGKLDKAS